MRLSITAATFLFCSCAQGFAPSLSSSRQSNAVVQNAVISSQWTMDEPVPEVSFMFFCFFSIIPRVTTKKIRIGKTTTTTTTI